MFYFQRLLWIKSIYYKAYHIIFLKCKSNYFSLLLQTFKKFPKDPMVNFKSLKNSLQATAPSNQASFSDSTLLHSSMLLLHPCWTLCSTTSAPDFFFWACTYWSLRLECLSLFVWLPPINSLGLDLYIISCRKLLWNHFLPTTSGIDASPMQSKNTLDIPYKCTYCTYENWSSCVCIPH